MLPQDTAQRLITLGYVLDIDFDTSFANGEVVLQWFSQQPRPTDDEINAVTQLQIDTAKLVRLRNQSKAFFASQQHESAVIRAFMLLVLDELNAHTTKTNAILTAIDNASSLAQLKTAVAAITDLPTRTAQQLRTAIETKINAGDADT